MGSFLMGATGTGNSFAAQSAPIQGQDFEKNLAESRGQANDVMGNQNQLGSILMNQLQGGGPSPEKLEAQQMNEAAIKSNAGMIGSQKGISPALAARTAAMNSAGMQQQAAGQGAMMGLNKQMAVQGALQNLYGQQGQQALGMNSNDQNAIGSYNNAQVGNTSNMNNTNQATQAQNAKTAGGLVGGLMGGLSGGLFAKGGVVPPVQHFAGGGQAQPQQQPYDITAGYQGPQGSGGAQLGQMLMHGLMSMFGKKKPAAAPNEHDQYAASGFSPEQMSLESSRQAAYDAGGLPAPSGADMANAVSAGVPAEALPDSGGAVASGSGTYAPVDGDPFAGIGPSYEVGKMNPDFMANGGFPGDDSQEQQGGGGAMGMIEKIAPLAMLALAKGGDVPDHFQHMAQIYHPDFTQAKTMKAGGPVPGKPEVSGSKNTTKNDTVPAMLSPGEIVLPRSVTQSSDPVKAAAHFVAEQLKKKNGQGNHSADFHDALAEHIKTRKAK